MTDLATLGLRIESHEADTASARMDKMKASASGLERATDSLASSTIASDGAIAGLLASIDRTTREMLELSRMHQQAGGAALVHAGATEKLATEIQQASTAHMYFGASFRAAQTDMGGAAAAMRNYAAAVGVGTREIGQADSHMALYRATVGKVGTGLKLTAQDGLNFSRQMADIGVTAAMGMSPLMIAVQQGPQLFDQLQVTAARSSMSIRATMAATGAVVWTALAPILPLIGALALGAGTLAAAWGLSARAITKDIGDVGKEMGLTEDQLERLKEKNISTTATAGDVWRGLGTTIADVLKETFGDQVDWADKQWNAFLDDLTRNTGAEVDAIAGFFVGTYRAVVALWKTFPAVFGDAVAMAANAGASILNDFLKNSVEELNFIIRQLNTIHRLTGGTGTVADEIKFGGAPFRTDRQTSGAAANIAAEYSGGYESMQGFAGRQADRVRENTRDSRERIIRENMGDAGADSPAGRAARDAKKLTEELDKLPRIDLQPLRVHLIQLVDPAEQLADKLRLINALAQDSARGMASAFGETGRSMGDLLTTMTAYESRLAAITVAYNKGQLDGADADRERAHAQVNYYGDTLAAAKTFFAEGSDGYRALQAAEAAWRVFSFAMSVQAMAQQAAETSASVAGSAAKGSASAAAGAAKMFEALGPFGFPVVAAMIALLASMGLKGKGGGGGSSPSLDGSVAKSQGYAQQADTTRSSFAASVAQKVDVRVSADRDGIKAYIEGTAAEVAAPMVAQGMAAAAGATRAQVMSDLDKGRTYSRGG